jgi:alpha-tubulin suppressor-like RCC1 family protein
MATRVRTQRNFAMTTFKLIQTGLLCAGMVPGLICGAQSVTNVSTRSGHTLFIKSDGSLWAMGDNTWGQLGDGSNVATNWPEQIVASNVTVIAAGSAYSVFLKNDGSLWGMGQNHMFGSLGNGTYNDTNRPEFLTNDVTAIAAGDGHTLFRKSNGSLWGMGQNDVGQLGDGTRFNYRTNVPERIVAHNVTTIAAGYAHSLFIKGDGSLWGMGLNLQGQLGDGFVSGPGYTNLPEMIVASNVTAIAAGEVHSLFIKSDGSLWGMGQNGYGQLGNGTYDSTNLPEKIVGSNVTAIAAGTDHSLFIKSDGSLWGMGNNYNGQLGSDAYLKTDVPQQIAASNVTAITAGYWFSLFCKSDGSLWAMGHGQAGQFGNGTNYDVKWLQRVVAGQDYNHFTGELLRGGDMRLAYVGFAGRSYALERSTSLAPANWLPQTTNSAGLCGTLVLTNTPNPAANNFWRIRSVP